MTTKELLPDKKNSIHRTRVRAALNHQPSDRFPLTLGSPSCSLHQIAHSNLLDFLGFSHDEPQIITDNILQITETDCRIIEYFDIDLQWLLPKEGDIKWDDRATSFVDDFGRTFKSGGGFFNQVAAPLENVNEKIIEEYKFPKLSKSRFAHLGAKALELYNQGYGLGIDGPWGLYEISASLLGTSQYLMSLALNPTLARIIAERVLEQYLIPFYDLLLADTSDYVQIVGISDDLGSQTALIFSPTTYREIFKPLHQQLIDHIRSKTDAKIFMHSDGAIYPIIPDLIEIGVDGLNPIQYTAKNMGLKKLVAEFGKDL